MKRSIIFSTAVFVLAVCSGSAVPAQEYAPRIRNQVPLVRIGLLYGRPGTATGPSSYVEVNPIRWFGVCGIVSHSQTTHAIDGGYARVTDLSKGGCVTAHAPQMKGFLVSPFVQLTWQTEHNRIGIPLEDGSIYHDGSDDRRRIWTIGTTIDHSIVKNGPRWAVRIGKNFGTGPTVQNAGGLYFAGGIIFPLGHPSELGRSFRKMLGWKTHDSVSASTKP